MDSMLWGNLWSLFTLGVGGDHTVLPVVDELGGCQLEREPAQRTYGNMAYFFEREINYLGFHILL